MTGVLLQQDVDTSPQGPVAIQKVPATWLGCGRPGRDKHRTLISGDRGRSSNSMAALCNTVFWILPAYLGYLWAGAQGRVAYSAIHQDQVDGSRGVLRSNRCLGLLKIWLTWGTPNYGYWVNIWKSGEGPKWKQLLAATSEIYKLRVTGTCGLSLKYPTCP